MKETEIAIKEEVSISNEEWYQSLIEDCQAIGTERGTNARLEVIQGKWEIGERINQANEEMERKKIYGLRIIENLSNDLGVSSTDLWNCVKFYKEIGVETFDDAVPKLPEGKNVSWYKITLWLGDRKDSEKDKVKKSYKLADILDVFKLLVISKGASDEEEIEKSVTEFREVLVNYKRED